MTAGLVVMPGLEVEEELIADDNTASARRLGITKVPCALFPRRPDKLFSVGSIPIKSVTTETSLDLAILLKTFFSNNIVFRFRPDREEPQHQTFIGRNSKTVEFRFDVLEFGVWMASIQVVGSDPIYRIAFNGSCVR